jgi:hypothetical protein
MKNIKHVMIGLSVMFSVTLVLGLTVFAEEKKQEISEEDKKMMELMEKYATPGENHKHLDYFVGEWESLVKTYGEPGSEPMTHKQEITVKWVLGGRYLRAHLKGVVVGRPYDVLVFTGYDNYNEQVFAIQFSNMDTGYFMTTGTLSKDGKVRTETGIMNDAPGKRTKVKAVTTLLDRNKYKYEFYTIDAKGKETKIMEINYTRK